MRPVMNKNSCLISFIVVFMALIGCDNRRYSSQFDSISELMEEHPDSALVMLDSIQLSDDAPDGDKAMYGLLLTQARYKNFIDETNDSLITLSADYFIRVDDKGNGGMALFLAGMIQCNDKRLADAALSFTRGLDLVRGREFYMVEGLCSQGLYLVYGKLFDGSGQIKYAEESLDAFNKLGDESWINYALYRVALAYNNNGSYSESIPKASEVITRALEVGDTALATDASSLAAMSYFMLGDYSKAVDYYLNTYKLDSTIFNNQDRTNLIIAESRLTTESVSDKVLHIIEETGKDIDDDYPFEVLSQQGRYEEAYKDLEKCMHIQDSILSSVLKNNVSGTLRNYEQSREELQREKLRNERLMWVLIVMSVMVLGTAIAIYLRRNLRETKRRQEEIMKEADYVRTDLLRQIETNTRISESVKELFRQKYDVVDNLCAAYYESRDTKLEKKRIVEEVGLIFQEFTDDRSRLSELADYADRYTDGAYTAFNTDFPRLKDEDRRLFLYLMMGFSSRSISIFLKEKIEVVYNRKSRLKARIRNSNAQRKEEFLAYCDISR